MRDKLKYWLLFFIPHFTSDDIGCLSYFDHSEGVEYITPICSARFIHDDEEDAPDSVIHVKTVFNWFGYSYPFINGTEEDIPWSEYIKLREAKS